MLVSVMNRGVPIPIRSVKSSQLAQFIRLNCKMGRVEPIHIPAESYIFKFSLVLNTPGQGQIIRR